MASDNRFRDHVTVANQWFLLGACATLIVAIVIAFIRGLNSPFVFDDSMTVKENPSIVRLWPPMGTAENPGPLNPPKDWTTAGRPLVNFTLAVNYRLGEFQTFGYHLFNVVIHILSTLLLGLIVRRTLQLNYFGGQFAAVAGPLSFSTALLWALQPLQTETVTYVTQRSELMVGLFYLATLYSALRYWDSSSLAGKRVWLFLASLCCLAGMACKEVMVTAPIVVLLFERTFIAGSFRQTVRRSLPLYVGLAIGWILLIALNYNGPRSASAGFNLEIAPVQWWLIQAKVVWLYLKLVVWPWPLSIHYPFPQDVSFRALWPWLLATVMLGAVVLVLLWQRRSAGFVGACAILILSPTLVVPIVSEVAAERRMYLPLAALFPLTIAGSYWLLISSRRKRFLLSISRKLTPRGALVVVSAIAALLALIWTLLDVRRLDTFQSRLALWQEAVSTQPNDPLAHHNLAAALVELDRPDEALAEFQQAVKLKPDAPLFQSDLGNMLAKLGRLSEALEHIQLAMKGPRSYGDVYYNLGIVLLQQKRTNEAILAFANAVKLAPNNGPSQRNLGALLVATGRPQEAIGHLEEALRLQPNQSGEINEMLGQALATIGKPTEAIEHFQEAIRTMPELGEVHESLGIVYAGVGRLPEALEQFKLAVQFDQDDAEDYKNLAIAYAQLNRLEEAVSMAEKALARARLDKNTELIKETETLLNEYRDSKARQSRNQK
jgi:tetratricopeptide (TPR) repeat protein